MIFTFWPAEYMAPGITISCQRWWDGLQLAIRLFGDRPAEWRDDTDIVGDGLVAPDYETRWIGSAARSSADLVFQYRKVGLRKWHPLT